MKVGIIRDIFNDKKWSRYSIATKQKDSFGIADRDCKYYNAYETFEEYFGKDFITPMECEVREVEEPNYKIKIIRYGTFNYIHLFYKK